MATHKMIPSVKATPRDTVLKALEDRMKKSRMTEDDILEAARERKGIEKLEQIKYAILEKNGAITIIASEVPEDVNKE